MYHSIFFKNIAVGVSIVGIASFLFIGNGNDNQITASKTTADVSGGNGFLEAVNSVLFGDDKLRVGGSNWNEKGERFFKVPLDSSEIQSASHLSDAIKLQYSNSVDLALAEQSDNAVSGVTEGNINRDISDNLLFQPKETSRHLVLDGTKYVAKNVYLSNSQIQSQFFISTDASSKGFVGY